MDLIVCSSRGRDLAQHLDDTIRPVKVIVKPGGKYSELKDMALDHLRRNAPSGPGSTYVYFFAGLPDVTSSAHSRNWKYHEVIFV